MNWLSSITQRAIGGRFTSLLVKLQRQLMTYAEYIIGGGRGRELFLVKLLERHYTSKFRRQWILSVESPHFFDHRMGFFWLAFTGNGRGPYSYFRGFFTSEILRDGDRLLDIGCGDGFLDRRFYAERCAHIDAIDIDTSAVSAAKSYHRAPNINYHLLDAVSQPFPGDKYNVIALDGPLGHIQPDGIGRLLEKICRVLASDGVFVGSESLGTEGADHLQSFKSLDDVYHLFKPYFRYIELRSVQYRIGPHKNPFLREEAYWRCSNDSSRLQECHWHEFRNISNT